MLYVANWTLVSLLLGLWSLAAWAFHGVVVWALTKAPSLTSPAGDLSSIPVPAWLLQFLPVEAIQSLIVGLTETWTWVSVVLQAAPSVAAGVTALTWAVWGLGAAVLVALGAGVHIAAALWARRSRGEARFGAKAGPALPRLSRPSL